MTELASEGANNEPAVRLITQAEFHAAIGRRRRSGDLDEGEVRQAAERFDNHLRKTFQRRPVNDRTLNIASNIVLRHALRASDAVQLAACIILTDGLILNGGAQASLTFVCADRRPLTAAQSEGLLVLNPESQAALAKA